MRLAMALMLTLSAGAACAQAEDPGIEQARAGGVVGEMFNGYLGFHGEPSLALKAKVDDVNMKRRAIYTDIAARQKATVEEVATARGCDQLSKRVRPGEWYRPNPATWQQRGAGAVVLPSACG